jgi:Protein of unknown function (DUF3800)
MFSTVSPLHIRRLAADHPTAWVFLDETGVVHQRTTSQFFGIGILKLTDPAPLLGAIQRLRDHYEFRGELHWANFDKAQSRYHDEHVRMAQDVMDLVFESDDTHFCCHIADRQHGDLTAKFKGHAHSAERAYEDLASKVLREVILGDEIVSIIADRRSASREVNFEAELARSVNQAKDRLAVANVCRVDSRSTDALQVVDLLLGAATLDLRQGQTESGSQKQQLLNHLLTRCDCPTFRPNGLSDPSGKWKVKLLTRSRKTRRKQRGRRH